MSTSQLNFSSQTTLNVSEGYDLQKQRYYVKKNCSCCDCFHRRCFFRVWQIFLFLFTVAAIITLLGFLIAMFGPGNTKLSYSEKQEEIVASSGNGDSKPTCPEISPTTRGEAETTTDVTETTSATVKENTTGVRETTRSTTIATATSLPTTAAPDHTSIECGVAIVGGGTAGLVLAHFLFKYNLETDVCIFEKETRLGGKIFDHRFPEAPNISVGLGQWVVYSGNDAERDAFTELNVISNVWTRRVRRVEVRGVFAESFDTVKLKAFPTLSDRKLKIQETAKNVSVANSTIYSTAGAFLSSYLSPEGAKLLEYVYGFKGGFMQEINPVSYQEYLAEAYHYEKDIGEDERPHGGMSELIKKLESEVRSSNGKIHLSEKVTSVVKDGNKFVLQTTNYTVKANKTVLTPGPTALKKMTGDVIQNITDNELFKSIVSVPAFFGAAVYPSAWWNDSTAAQKNNTLKDLDMFISSSNCLGITMPYKGSGPNGVAVLHTVANKGGCSDDWGNILKISKDNDVIDKEMKRALEYKFQREIPVEPLNTVYKYWDDGFWYYQKPGTNFLLSDIRNWAKRPLPGNDVFLVGKAFYNFGGWLTDTLGSTNEALNEGWKRKLPWE